jgi:hypothetical protein
MAALVALLSVEVTAEPLVQKALFVKGAGGYNNYRIPALITTHKGTLLAFCEGREGGDSSDIDLLLRRSEDGGKSWTPKQVVWGPREKCLRKPMSCSRPRYRHNLAAIDMERQYRQRQETP